MKKVRPGRLLIYAALVMLAAVYLVPVYMTVITSLKAPEAIQLASAWLPPDRPHWQSYATAWDQFAPKLKNSLLLAVTATLLSAALGSLNGYVLSKWTFRGAGVIFPLMVFGMFIPYQSILIPLFQFLRNINLYGGLPGLILVHVVYGLPITTLLFRNFYAEIPDELVSSASIDGGDFFRIYRWIMLPLSGPAFVVVAIWQFTQIWNEFLFAVTLTRPDAQPVTVALANLAGGQAVYWNLPTAGSILAALPTVLVYILLGRFFMRGLLAGALKG
ncbi:carbohydrate ABC transporter permease [Carboxydochorda subterranea]|uniref:Carbohydrate ABC transporter permease n=1 Tax=Carboxydichorda subterranea TaxID=3109565 RepID=A0ABZ1BZD3_9FIRM|nr:carbohydrate ABC transporter permease [Limnochorda sp. L945t]WRP18162.1 carbohydrate ABC transporter permease [Limnochorda sp. L945t]